MNVSKKIFMGLIYIYISIAALSAENIIGVGLSFPTLMFSKNASKSVKGNDTEFLARHDTLSDTKLRGTQVTFGLKHIFDNRFVLGGDLGVGAAKLKLNDVKDPADYLLADLNLSLGVAAVRTDRVTLILSGILGARIASMDDAALVFRTTANRTSDRKPWDRENPFIPWDESGRYLALNVGGEVFANFQIAKTVGLFASCKVTNSFGNLKKKYRDNVNCASTTVTYKRTSALAIAPSAGISFKL